MSSLEELFTRWLEIENEHLEHVTEEQMEIEDRLYQQGYVIYNDRETGFWSYKQEDKA